MAGAHWWAHAAGDARLQQAAHGGGSAAAESRNGPHARARSRARVVSVGELIDDVGDERPDDGNGVGDATAGAGGVDDKRARVRSRRDADEAS